MSQADPRIPEYVAVECPVCYTRMHARPAKAAGKIKCPDCDTLARVPSISEIVARLPRVRAPEVIGTYDLGAGTNPIVEDATPEWPSTGAYGLSARLTETYDTGSAPEPRVSPAVSEVGPPGARPPDGPRGEEPRQAAGSPPRDRAPSGPPEQARPVEAEAAPPPGAFTVACPACGARIEPPVSDRPQTILCPECLEDVPVLPRAGGAAARAGSRSDAAAPGAPLPEQRERRVGTERQESPRLHRAESPSPQSGSGARSERRGEPARRSKTRQAGPAAPAPSDQSAGTASTAASNDAQIEFSEVVYPQPPRGPVNVFEALAEIRQEKPDPPPRSTFFSGVFEFPWRPDMLLRWIYLTVGFTVFGIVVSGYVLMAESVGIWLLVLILFMPPLVAAAGLTLSYAASCFLPILIDTAAGNDRIRSWFDPDWKEWVIQFMYLVCMLFVALLFGHVIGVLAGLTGETYAIVLGVGTYFAFPIILLSSQEANSLFIPVTLPILRSMLTSAWVWLTFYALSGILVGTAALLIRLESEVSPFLALMGSGPVVATVCLLYPRLLGRLAWRASLSGSRRRRRKRRGVPQAEFPAPAGGIK